VTRRHPRLRRSPIAAALILAAACAPARSPAPAPSPTPDAPASGAAAPAAPSWEFRYAPGTRRYRVESEATVELRSDSSHRQAPIRTSGRVTIALSGVAGQPLALSATVDDYDVERGDAIPEGDGALPRRASLRGTLSTTGELTVPAAPREACDPADALVAAARELLVAVPPSLAPGTRWSDSASTTLCRGGVPVTTGIVRDYEVDGRERVDGTDAIRVRRRDRFTLAGASAVPGRTMVVSGRGTGTATLWFDPAGGRYLGMTWESDAELSVRAGRQSSNFRQRVRQQARLER
jgi:hypothetical protein